MKRLQFILLLLFFSNAFSQQLVEKNKTWSIAEFGTGSIPYKLEHCYTIKTGLDTIINDKTYLNLLISNDSLLINWSGFNRCLRQEDKKVFCYNIQLKEEYLLYDFGLSKNDSFNVYRIGIYINVDSLKDIDAKKHFYLSYHSSQTEWIENVGCLDGLLSNSGNIDLVGSYSTLLCCKSGDKIIYQNPEYNSCYLFTTAPTLETKEKLIMLFDVGNSLLKIQTTNMRKGDFYLFSIDGRKLLKEKISRSEMMICTPLTGIMFYRFETEKGEVQTGKVVAR